MTTTTPAQTSSGQAVKIQQLQPGTNAQISSSPSEKLEFDFDIASASFVREGNSLVISQAGGGSVTIVDFFVVGNNSLPDFVLPTGDVVSGLAFLQSQSPGMDISPAAGSASDNNVSGSGINDYSDNTGIMVSGINRLESLGTDYWNKPAEVSQQNAVYIQPELSPFLTTPLEGAEGPGDGVPSISLEGVAVPTLAVDESDMSISASASFAELFAAHYGADGAGSIVYELGINDDTASTGLYDAATGRPITLTFEGGYLVGKASGVETVFRLSVESETGRVTLEQLRPIMHESQSASSKDLAADLITLTATITDKDGDSESISANIGGALQFGDGVPSISLEGVAVPTLAVDESDMSISASASFAGLFAAHYGADGAGSIVYELGINDDTASTGLYDAATGRPITLTFEGGYLVGKASGVETVFRLSVESETGRVTLEQLRPIMHESQSASSADLAADLITLTATITDKDGDSESISANIGGALQFGDGVPSISLEGVTVPTLAVDESDMSISASASFAELFAAHYGADGAGSIVYELGINDDTASTGLYDAATGRPITLTFEGGYLVGKASGVETVFRLSVESETGRVTLEQLRPIMHESQSTSSADLAADLITLTATITDKDGDSESISANIGGALQFEKSSPHVLPKAFDNIARQKVEVLEAFDEGTLNQNWTASATKAVTNVLGTSIGSSFITDINGERRALTQADTFVKIKSVAMEAGKLIKDHLEAITGKPVKELFGESAPVPVGISTGGYIAKEFELDSAGQIKFNFFADLNTQTYGGGFKGHAFAVVMNDKGELVESCLINRSSSGVQALSVPAGGKYTLILGVYDEVVASPVSELYIDQLVFVPNVYQGNMIENPSPDEQVDNLGNAAMLYAITILGQEHVLPPEGLVLENAFTHGDKLTVSATGEYTYETPSSDVDNVNIGYILKEPGASDTSSATLYIRSSQYNLLGTEGDDAMDYHGESHNLVVDAKGGDDIVDGGGGNDVIYGGAGEDALNGYKGDDTLHGGAGNDTLNGGDNNDSLCGGAGIDILDGGAGNDILYGGAGADTLYGGLGNDTFVWVAEDYDGGADSIKDFMLGNDKLCFAELFATAGEPSMEDILSRLQDHSIDINANDNTHLTITLQTKQVVEIQLAGSSLTGEQVYDISHDSEQMKAELLQQMLTGITG